ncbi:MAG: hypothetical protein HC894_25220 [Microcoleus sp. SM1_3_4]|nr:hypothetical protein [Microcoleus sp. SM1_3_4]
MSVSKPLAHPPLQVFDTVNCQRRGRHGGTPSASLRPYLSTVNCQLSTIKSSIRKNFR